MEEMIEKYLLGLLSKEDRKAFELRIGSEPTLAAEVNVQRDLMQAAKLQGLKADISNAYRQVKLGKMLKTAFITTLVAAVLGLAIFYVAKTLKPKIDSTEVGSSLPTSVFNIDNTKDTVIETQNGIILHIPAYAFGDVSTYDLEIKEALNALAIMEAGLSTMSDSNLLATAGMFKITATKDGKELQLADGKEITAQVPTDEVDPNMMLFDGEEDSTGNVNWVNPTKIKKHLFTRSFDELNFYPPGYLAKVAENGYDASNKQFTDSLYWSFDCGVVTEAEEDELDIATPNAEPEQTINTRVGFEFTEEIKSLYGSEIDFGVQRLIKELNIEDARQLYKGTESINIMTSDILNYLRQVNPEGYAKIQRHAADLDKDFGLCFDTDFSVEESKKVLELILFDKGKVKYFGVLQNPNFQKDEVAEGTMDSAATPTKQICPASIKALQTKRFAKTYIATKEFEQRLRHLFQVCDENSLNVYIANLDKDISHADSIVALRIVGSKKEIFQLFAAQKLGNTKSVSPAFAKLAVYHKKKKNTYDNAARKAREKVLNKYAKEDKKQEYRTEEKQLTELKARAENYQKELKNNLVEAYKQAGLDYNKIPTSRNYYTVPIDSTGWKNLDQFVTESTNTRTSLKTTYNGKDISIEYHNLNVKIAEEETFDFVNVYLIPNKLPSYQKLKKKDSLYFESINELFNYELVCLGKKGSDYFVYTDLLQKKDATKTVSLKSINKKELQKLLKSMNKSTANRNVSDDLEYEEQNFLYNQNLKKRKKDEAFRREIEDVIWPCNLPRTSQPSAPEAELFEGFMKTPAK